MGCRFKRGPRLRIGKPTSGIIPDPVPERFRLCHWGTPLDLDGCCRFEPESPGGGRRGTSEPLDAAIGRGKRRLIGSEGRVGAQITREEIFVSRFVHRAACSAALRIQQARGRNPPSSRVSIDSASAPAGALLVSGRRANSDFDYLAVNFSHLGF